MAFLGKNLALDTGSCRGELLPWIEPCQSGAVELMIERMNDALLQLARRHRVPLTPIPTKATPRTMRYDDIQAVVFDIYGTLLISGSGDVGSTGAALNKEHAAHEALQAMGFDNPPPGKAVVTGLHEAIALDHGRCQERGVEFPEVDIVHIWHSVLHQLRENELLPPGEVDCERLAVEYELRANPVDTMPGAAQLLDQLQSAEMVLGIVSNAQFFTPIVWAASFGRTITEMGFAKYVQYYSYEHRQAKPGTYLYQLAADGLATRGIVPRQVLYVGNDMRNDIWPAQQVGFRTALFAGDQRSLRLRTDDPKVSTLQPNIVISHLSQLPEVVGLS